MTRIEHDLLGDREVPDDAYYGIHTLRATENFPITGIPLASYPDLVSALASVKQAAAQANAEPRPAAAARSGRHRARPARRSAAGALRDQFVVDVIQGGAGTSTNMNANEVIANRALELLGHRRGDYEYLHPLEHVNLSQSTNDVYPTAIKAGAANRPDQAAGGHAGLGGGVRGEGRRSSPTSSRSAAPSCRMRFR